MHAKFERPLGATPATVESVDRNGRLTFKIMPRVLTPSRARLADHFRQACQALAAICCAVALLQDGVTVNDAVQVGLAATFGYFALTALGVAMLRKKTTILMSQSTIAVRRWNGWQSFDRNLGHRFALHLNDLAKEEARRIDFEQREDSLHNRALQRKPYFADSYEVVLIYAGHRVDLLSVYGEAEAAAVTARLQYCDRRLNDIAGMGGGAKEHPENEWAESTGGLK